MSFAVPRIGRSALAALATGGVLSALALAPSAEAAFSIARCTGSNIDGRGATFQNNAHQRATGWASLFQTQTGQANCPGGPLVQYNPAGMATGSGAGRSAMGSGDSGVPAGQRDPQVRFAGSDEGPNQAQMQNMNTGQLANSADDGDIHVIPAAASAVAVIVNYPTWDHDNNAATLPESCPLPDGFRQDGTGSQVAGGGGYDRLRLPNVQLEKLWAGDYSTWGDLIPALVGHSASSGNPGAYTASCVSKKIIRVVRNDTSGTTFAFKDFLNEAVAGLGAASSGTAWRGSWLSGDLNRRWPETLPDNDTRGTGELANEYGDIADADSLCEAAYVNDPAIPTPVCRSSQSGAGGVRDVVNKNPGSVGYVDLATAVAGGAIYKKSDDRKDVTYFLPLEVRSTGTYVEPTFDAQGYKPAVTTGGANCRNVPVRKLPRGTFPSKEIGWEQTTMVWPTAGYSDCSLTYILAFDDNAPVYLSLPGTTYAEEERRARTLKDYLEFIVSDAGQSALIGNDYAPLPKTIAPGDPDGTKSAWAIADAAVKSINWDKQGIGSGTTQPPVDNGNNNPPGGGGGGGGGTTPPAATPPTGTQPPAAQPPVNLFTVGSARKKANDLISSFRLPGAGRLQVTATGSYTEKAKKGKKAKKAKKRSLTVGKATVAVTRAGDVSVKLPMSAKARSALKKAKRITVKVTAVYTPTGGTARTITRTLTLRA